MRVEYVTARDGTRIAYTVGGKGGIDVVLSNGIGCNEVFLRYLVEDLSEKFRVISWHYRGHVNSGIPEDMTHTDYPYLIDDLKLVLDDAGVRKAAFIGFSMGVEINFEFYRLHPEMVTALVPACGTFEFCLRSFFGLPVAERLFPLVLRLVRKRPKTMERIWRRTIGGPLAFPLARLAIFNWRRVKRSDFFDYHPHISNIDKRCFLEMAGYLAGHSARDLLPRIDVPTLIVAGTRDNFTPIRVSREMASLIPGSRLVEIKGGSHGTLIEFPEKVNPIVINFLKEL